MPFCVEQIFWPIQAHVASPSLKLCNKKRWAASDFIYKDDPMEKLLIEQNERSFQVPRGKSLLTYMSLAMARGT